VPSGKLAPVILDELVRLDRSGFLTLHIPDSSVGWQKLEIFCVIIGTVMIVAGYIGRSARPRGVPSEKRFALAHLCWQPARHRPADGRTVLLAFNRGMIHGRKSWHRTFNDLMLVTGSRGRSNRPRSPAPGRSSSIS